VYLDRNENLYGPAPKCFDVLRSIGMKELSLYSRDFQRGVKSRLTERLAVDLKIPEQQILLSEGSEDMLKQVIHCYVNSGEKILCPAQSWWYYQVVASEVGGVTVQYKLKEGMDRFHYDVDEMISLYAKESPRVVLIASPNNPTGNSLNESDLQRLTEAFSESIIVLDEAYWGFADTSIERTAEQIKSYRNVLILRTFSKYYALAGARIAYAVVGSDLTRLTKFASHYLGYNRISEALALAAWDSSDYYRTITDQMRKDRKRFYDVFDAKPGFTCFRSDANFVLVRIPTKIKEVTRDILKEKGIAIKFFLDTEFPDCIRITLGTREQNERLLEALQMIVSKNNDY
jgi:Histidinol-phosphate/aromatic aminotransferase and cobyric acid decarboxylase